MFHDFVDFIAKYNIFGVAIGLLIATKVGELVKGMIENLITPLILNPTLKRLKVKKMEDLSYK
jgi:large conductance mechanosensitive channel